MAGSGDPAIPMMDIQKKNEVAKVSRKAREGNTEKLQPYI